MGCDLKAVIWPLMTPLKHPIRTSFGAMESRPLLLLQLVDENGIEGWGEAWVNYPPWALDERGVVLHYLLQKILKRSSTHDAVRDIIKHYRKQVVQSAGLGAFYHALSAIDAALWDLEARRQRRPLREILVDNAAQLSEIPVYASGIGPEDVRARVESAINEGFTTVKIKVGFDDDIDHENFRVVQSSRGIDGIIVDANQAWTRTKALREVQYYDGFGIEWVEEPISALDFEGYHLLGHQSHCIAAGENWYLDQVSECPSIRLKALQPDLCKVGGVGAARSFLRTSALHSDFVAFHVLGGPIAQALSLQVASAWGSRVRWVEFDTNENLARDAMKPSWVITRGKAQLNQLPGLGLQIDTEHLEKFVAPHLRPFHKAMALDMAY